MKHLLLILTLWNFGSSNCFSQQMDTFILKDFEIKNVLNMPKNIGSVKLNINTIKYNTLADALRNQTALFIKQYGTGALATASMRGMGSQHTAVMWNGVNINSCMNSNVDFNLIPLFFVDLASIETGANSAACGNGAIAGAIYLSNTIEKENQVFGNLQMGSFGYYQAGIGISYSLKNVRYKTRVLYRKSENDILYHNRFVANAPSERQVNSAYTQKGFLQEIDFNINTNNGLKVSAWFLESNRELPASMGVTNLAKEKQNDLNVRLAITHQYKHSDKLNVNNKIAILNDKLDYYNAYYPTSYNTSKSLIAESEWVFKVNRYNRITSSLNNNYSTAKADGYLNWPGRNMFSYWLKYEWQNRKENFMLSIGSRLLLVNKKIAPFSPDAAFQYSPFKVLKIKGNVAYSYRVPSFNDYFWQQGGNKNLNPERGFKQELSAEIKQREFKFSGTVFHHVVNDWILWLPVNGGTYWQAQNARQVTSAGVEIAMDYLKNFGQHQIQLLGRYQFVESINTKVYGKDQLMLNKQLFYTPKNTAVATINYKYNKLFFYITEQFIGSRFTTSDNLPEYQLPYYLLTNATLGYQLNFKKHFAVVSFTANNIFNTEYQVMVNRPTPLRNFQITLKFNIINE